MNCVKGPKSFIPCLVLVGVPRTSRIAVWLMPRRTPASRGGPPVRHEPLGLARAVLLMRLLHTQNEYRDVVARPPLAELEHLALDPRGDLGGVEAAATPQQVHKALFPEQAGLRARL